MKTIFTFDIERNYAPTDVLEYQKRISILSQNFPYKFEIVDNYWLKSSQTEWINLQRSVTDFPDIFKQKALYVFFEIPERVREYYIKNSIPYLNFMTPKIRFPNLPPLFMVESNLDIPREVLYPELVGVGDVEILPEYSGKTLILGQMWGDRSVIFEGESKDILDYPVKGDIYRPHPNSKRNQPEYYQKCLTRAAELGLEVREDGDIYQVLTSVKKAIGISSSSLYEAQILGTEVEFVGEKEYIKNAELIEISRIDKEFWEKVVDLAGKL